MQIVVTGGTGFVGQAVVDELLELGHRVVIFTRDASSAAPDGAELVTWDPTGAIPSLDGFDAIVHLAGETAVGRRLTERVAHEVRESRIRSTELLVEALERATHRPRVFLCASAVGYYGARPPHEELDEGSSAGDDFLARLCVDWEAAARRAEPLGVRVVNTRLGIVFGRGGGALERMATPFRWFVGGPLGDGKQVVSWIHRLDVARALAFCLEREELRGPVNVTAPEPLDNEELSALLGRVLGRPSAFRVPGFALRALFGEGAEPILTGQRVLPKRLTEAGFRFEFPSTEQALRDALDA